MKRSFKEFININDLPVPPVEIIRKLEEKVLTLEKKNHELTKENEELKKELENYKNKNENSKDCISVIFMAGDQNAHCSLICNKNDDFKTIEKRFYDKYPDYKETESENTFSVRNNNIDRSKTLEDNSIRDSDIIMLN